MAPEQLQAAKKLLRENLSQVLPDEGVTRHVEQLEMTALREGANPAFDPLTTARKMSDDYLCTWLL